MMGPAAGPEPSAGPNRWPRSGELNTYLGIDIGGSGIKGAPVDTATGRLTAERIHIATPVPARPEAVAEVVATISQHFGGDHHIGCTFPGVVMRGVIRTAANLDPAWVGLDAHALLGHATHRSVTVLNDADAAGIAEMAFGAGRQRCGVVLMVTLGTGIGTALFLDGRLVPNTEFGHLEVRGKDAERRAAARVRDERHLTWKRWAGRVDEYLGRLEALCNPELIIIGGGVSARAERFLPLLHPGCPVIAAQLQNEAGIVGAALHVRDAVEAAARPRPSPGRPVARRPAAGARRPRLY